VTDDVKLSNEDVLDLLRDPSANMRATTARKVAGEFSHGEMTEQERDLAEEIFRLMLQDAEVRVRQALSEGLKENPEVPKDVAVGLAQDVSAVAEPMLRFSDVLTDQDLIEIVASQSADHQIAIAERATVSEQVSDALASTQNETVVATLLGNDAADISENTFQRVLDDFGDSEKVSAPMALRTELPVAVSERLVTLVSDELKHHLVTHHAMSANVATDLILQSREKATLSLVGRDHASANAEALVRQLHENGRLTATIILRSLCLGDLDFFESAMARLAGIPVVNAHMLIFDRGDLGLRALYDKCELPAKSFPIVCAAAELMKETDYDGGPNDRERYRAKMIERVLTSFEDDVDTENLDYLINRLNAEYNEAA
jgi:uncharacterized protein (DUF2336 family)